MKKSHRKDVIIARIIFACMVLILIAVIVFGVKTVMRYRADRSSGQEPDTTVTETSQPDADTEADSDQQTDNTDQWIVDDTETESTGEDGEADAPAEGTDGEAADNSEQVLLKAQYSVNIRSGAGKENPVVGGVEEGGIVILLEEEDNGWGYIQKDDLTGYVYLAYFQYVDSE